MRKKYEELNESEKHAFVNELARMFKFGSACIIASAKNEGAERGGWPPISIGIDLQVSMCDALDFLRKTSREGVIRELMKKPFGLAMVSISDIEELAVHEAMHDAFFFGIAAASLMELDFSGVEEILQSIEEDDSHVR